jgi:hypothetical protein
VAGARYSDAQSAIVVDDRYFPVLISTWFGEPSEGNVRRYFEWSAVLYMRLCANRQRYVLIQDALEVQRPSPRVRGLIAELADSMPDAASLLLGSYTILGSALVRGALTALQWVVRRRTWQTTAVGTMREAMARACGDLERAGLAIPRDFDPARYARPARS